MGRKKLGRRQVVQTENTQSLLLARANSVWSAGARLNRPNNDPEPIGCQNELTEATPWATTNRCRPWARSNKPKRDPGPE